MSRLRNLMPGGLLMGGLLVAIACSSGVSKDSNARHGNDQETEIGRVDPMTRPETAPLAGPGQAPAVAQADAARPRDAAGVAADSKANAVQPVVKPDPASAPQPPADRGARPDNNASTNTSTNTTGSNATGSTGNKSPVPDRTTGKASDNTSGDASGLSITATQPVKTPAATQHLLTPKASADKAKSKPRNLQVLPKTWSRERVDKYMKNEIERGLGVKCEHCHDTDNYAADHPHKEAARRMMRMTRELNRDYFKGHSKVTCYSCHKGKKTP